MYFYRYSFLFLFLYSQLLTQDLSVGTNKSFIFETATIKGVPTIPSCCSSFESGTGDGINSFISYRHGLNPEYSLIGGLGYSSWSSQMKQSQSTLLIINGNQTPGEFTFKLNTEFSVFNINIAVDKHLFAKMFGSIAWQTSFISSNYYGQKEEITKPTDRGTFLDELGADSRQRIRNSYEGEIPELNKILFGPKINVRYELPLNKSRSLKLIPNISYYLNLNNIAGDDTWKFQELSAGISISYRLYQDEKFIKNDTILKRDTVERDNNLITESTFGLESRDEKTETFYEGNLTINQTKIEEHYLRENFIPVEISASVSAKGVYQDGTEKDYVRMTIEEVLDQRLHPLLPFIFFDENSSSIPERYTTLSATDINNFHEDNLYADSILGIYYNMLNIVGNRMKLYPKSILTLTGTNSNTANEQGNIQLSENRAQEVKNYLTRKWKISDNRIKLLARNLPTKPSNRTSKEGQEENRRVEISSNNPNVIAYINAFDTLRTVDPPSMRFYANAHSNKGITNWTIKVNQNNKTLRTFSGESDTTAIINWDIQSEQHNVPRYDSPINISIIAEDSFNTTARDEFQIELEQLTIRKKRLYGMGDKEIHQSRLILANFKDLSLDKNNIHIIKFLQSQIKDNSVVRVRGYTDFTGTEALNMRVSKERAEAVASQLKARQIIQDGFGESILLHDNSLPEGRMYCRTVTIDITTPVAHKEDVQGDGK